MSQHEGGESAMTFEQAAQALEQAGQQDAATTAAETPTPGSPASPPQAATPEGSGQQGATQTPGQAEDSFTQTDLGSLLAGVTDPVARDRIEAAYKSFQGDYTRKTQEIAPYRQLAEAGIQPERVTQALEFVQALETDPEFVVAVHQQLSEALTAAGLSPAQAQAEATRQVQSGEAFGSLEGGEYEEPESALAQEVAQLRDWVQQQQEREVERTLTADVQRADMAIRQANPGYTEDDMGAIYEMAFAHGGNLFAAQQSFETLRQRFAESYMNSKDATPAGVTPPAASGGFSEQPDPSVNLLDPEVAHKAAKAHLAQILANS